MSTSCQLRVSGESEHGRDLSKTAHRTPPPLDSAVRDHQIRKRTSSVATHDSAAHANSSRSSKPNADMPSAAPSPPAAALDCAVTFAANRHGRSGIPKTPCRALLVPVGSARQCFEHAVQKACISMGSCTRVRVLRRLAHAPLRPSAQSHQPRTIHKRESPRQLHQPQRHHHLVPYRHPHRVVAVSQPIRC